MRSLPFRRPTEKGVTEIHTSSASPKTQLDLPGSHVNNQDTTINPPSTPVQLELTTTVQEKSKVQVNSNDHPEYPHGLKLATITVAVAGNEPISLSHFPNSLFYWSGACFMPRLSPEPLLLKYIYIYIANSCSVSFSCCLGTSSPSVSIAFD
jgi:hypothetical protein